MMYNEKLAVAIKTNGQVLREFKDTVYVPFGSEYSILIKNLNTRSVYLSLYIDGQNQLDSGLILYAGQEIDLERSIRSSNLTQGNRFKFIERTASIEEHRGVGIEDGLVRIEYQFEKERVVYRTPSYNNWPILRGSSYTETSGFNCSVTGSMNNIQFTEQSLNDAGITVPGSVSTQAFSTTQMPELEPTKHNIVLKLLGITESNQTIVKPITVKHKPKCQTCGRQNRAQAKFCNQCGTALEVFS